MKNKLSKEQILGIIRHTMTFIGGVLITKGLLDEGILSEITGSILTLVGSIWSVIEKQNTEKEI